MVKDRIKEDKLINKSNQTSSLIFPERISLIPSESNEGAYYLIEKKGNEMFCSCPSFKYRNSCKHLKND